MEDETLEKIKDDETWNRFREIEQALQEEDDIQQREDITKEQIDKMLGVV